MFENARAIVALSLAWQLSRADLYLNSPRGSNNKLREQSNNVQNDERLFDSQNNAASGYQIGDDCRPACKDEDNNYDVTKEGATKGTMKYYQGSELYIDWYQQHGCGVGQPNLRCQIVVQYMCEEDNADLRDGTGQNTAGGDDTEPTAEETAEQERGYHEKLEYYQACRQRERNKGLYTADRNMANDQGATATRQNENGNQNGNRHGLECPEERDYYPYWHPTPWHDVAVFSDEPQERCDYYRSESQNVKEKGYCSDAQYNNPEACTGNEAEWKVQEPFEEPPPDCSGGINSRDNHNGNVRNGHPQYYLWKIPDYISGRCVLRVRYNITTGDFALGSTINPEEEGTELTGVKADPFFIDSRSNDPNPGTRRRTIFKGRPSVPVVISNDPVADWIGLGSSDIDTSRLIQLQANTNQLGRTFEDRTHTFLVLERPPEVPKDARIVNYNVRGRRGNIVQVYPSVEYDFVPQDLTVEEGTYLHFQWTGSDANNNNNAGNGRAGTDRSNLVQVAARGETVPVALEKHTLFFDASKNPSDEEGRRLVDKFAYLDQDSIVTCNPEQNNNNAEDNCKQLNGASAYFNGGLVQMKQVGVHHVASTRNNDFSNRSQKATITILPFMLRNYQTIVIAVGAVLATLILSYFAVAFYAYRHPGSWIFSKRYRPRVIRWVLKQERLEELVELRRQAVAQQRRDFAKQAQGDVEGAAEKVVLPDQVSWLQSTNRCLARFGLGENRLTTVLYGLLNLAVFSIGFFSNLEDGFKGSWAFPVAKGGGYSMDLNFAMLILPTLKSLQTTMRGITIPIDDPIGFHITVAGFIVLGALVHIAGHIWHMYVIKKAPFIQEDPLELWKLTFDEQRAGLSYMGQLFSFKGHYAPVTGVILTVIMLAIVMTAQTCVRRGTNVLTRKLGGYNLFWRMHMSWKWLYLILLLHAPARLWIWFFFPAIVIAVDRILLSGRQSLYLSLLQVKLLPRDVMGLTFELPQGFAYQAGQYILLGWNGEWHPFTLTSAPEERCISVHIRSPNSLDWCSALRRRLTEQAPANAAKAEPKAAKAGLVVEYSKHVLPNSSVIYNTPKVDAIASTLLPHRPSSEGLVADQPKLVGKANSGKLAARTARSGETLVGSALPSLPSEAVVLQVSGPFGAPAQKVWGFQTLMVVGAGIGVTPFASIMRSIQLRAKQRQAILGAAGARPASQWRNKLSNQPNPNQQMASTDADVGLTKLVDEMVTLPKRIYFYWIVRSQEEFDWFYDLLANAADGPASEIIDITLFLTGEIELSQVKKLPCASGQFFGRPNWGRIFKKKREEHQGEHVGVFLCGSPLIGKELARESAKNSDLIGTPGATRFSFFKEHF
mmetsp:Transcript_25366/g.45962  ORF Transcript_25366/g.45962 Transcript_25366/m.45962 type:complete len:1344 (-) Transcript_25366:286-4317(-)